MVHSSFNTYPSGMDPREESDSESGCSDASWNDIWDDDAQEEILARSSSPSRDPPTPFNSRSSSPVPGPSNAPVGPIRPYYPVQGPYLPPPLNGPEVPLDPIWARTPVLIRASIFRYLRLANAQTPSRQALNRDFARALSSVRCQRSLRRSSVNSNNPLPMVPPRMVAIHRRIGKAVRKAKTETIEHIAKALSPDRTCRDETDSDTDSNDTDYDDDENNDQPELVH